MAPRWIGIRVSAVLTILGSAVALLAAGLMLVSAIFSPQMEGPMSPKAMAAILISMAAIFAGFAAWGITTAVGAFRHKRWARVSFVIFGGVLTFLGGSAVLMWPMMEMPADPSVPVDMQRTIRLAIGVFYALLGGLGVWWLVLFNLRRTKEYFGGVPEVRVSGRPVSIGVIGWYLLCGVPMLLALPLLHCPAMIFGDMLTGSVAAAIYWICAAAQLSIGIGLLRLRAPARIGAIAYFVFTGLNGAVSLLRMDYRELLRHAQEAMPKLMPANMPTASPAPAPMTAILTLAYCALPIWFLVRRRAAFNALPPSSPIPG